MFLPMLGLLAALTLAPTQLVQASQQDESGVKVVAIFPWVFSENEKGTSEAGVDTAIKLLTRLFEDKAGMAVMRDVDCRRAWGKISDEPWSLTVEEPGQMPKIPSPKTLLKYGQAVGADFVCAGRLTWHVKSVWVGLGPKTKATAVVDCRIVDVQKQEVVFEVTDFRSDSTKAEKWYESAGALLVSWGITIFSGGPKTPHIQKAAVLGIGGATEPFFATVAQQHRKIKLDDDKE